jgi:hypothetical protein
VFRSVAEVLLPSRWYDAGCIYVIGHIVMTQHTDVTVIYNTQAAVIPLTDRADESTKR